MVEPLTQVEVVLLLHGAPHWLEAPPVALGDDLRHELRAGDHPGALRYRAAVDDGERVWVPCGVVTGR